MRDNLVVALRTESLGANLDKLKGRLSSSLRRRQTLVTVRDTLDTTKDQITNLTQALNVLKDGLDDLSVEHRKLDKAVVSKLEDLRKAVQELEAKQLKAAAKKKEARLSKDPRENVLSAIKSLDLLSERCLTLENSVQKHLITDLNDKTDEARAEVEGLKVKVLTASMQQATQVWTKLHETSQTQEQKLFSEYMEVLGGLALRDSEFDENISDLADELTPSYAGPEPAAFAIPIRRQSQVLETFKRVIRVSFPEWTIWALPATAREFWQIVERDKRLKPFRIRIGNLPEADRNNIDESYYDCLGDAFATFTVGPAYAAMAITLELNPSSERDRQRAQVIFAMLSQMDERHGGNEPYMSFGADLLHAWNVALQQHGYDPLSPDPETPEVKGTKVFIQAFEDALFKEISTGFTAEMWNEARNWSRQLLDREVDQIPVQGAELRHVLNAAWLARVDPECSMGAALTADVERLRDRVTRR